MTSSYAYREKRALIIGINDYQRDPLKYCVNDAKDLASALKNINFKVSFLKNCNLEEFYDIVDRFSAEIQCDDLVLFYFAGHGKQSQKENFMLPSDYHYNYKGHERDYIVYNAINVKYVMEKINNTKCCVAIYVFDCCRNQIRTRATNRKEGLAAMSGGPDTLVVYACGPNATVQDETRNDRNGSFIENLLKYITKPDKDIREIMENVTHDVAAQTNNFQVPCQMTSLKGNVFLVTNNNQETTISRKNDIRFTLNSTSRHSTSNDRPVHHDIDTSKNTTDLRRQTSEFSTYASNVNVTPINLEPTRSSNRNDKSRFPCIKSSKAPVSKENTPSDRTVRLTTINKAHIRPSNDIQTLRRVSVNDCPITFDSQDSNRLLSSKPRRLSENCTLHNSNTQHMHHPELYDDQKHTYDGDESFLSEHDGDSDIDKDILQKSYKYFQPSEHNSESISRDQQSEYDSSENDSENDLERQPTSSFPAASVETGDEASDSSPSNAKNTKLLNVRIRSLCRNYHVEVLVNTTMKDLIDIIWREVKFDMERYTKESHILLLFNHRLHIFVASDSDALVTDFLLLTPPASQRSTTASIDFYVYGVPRESVSSIYNFDDDYAALVGNPVSWCPAYFVDYKQLERSQSILLSALYALKLYFKPENRELVAERLAMEAQFFLQLRKYLFPPAILAFKHLIVGSMFWFEKSLLIDSLIQLLIRLCDSEKIDRNEICDFIPLLFCWLLEKCDANEQTEDCFVEVTLTNDNKSGCSYFQNPVTTSVSKRKALLLEECDEIRNHNGLQYHVDIRSLTLYLRRMTNMSNSSICECNHYIIYDPSVQDTLVLESLEYWTEFDIKDLFKIIAQTSEYRSFSIITRDGANADVNNQLVLLDENRTVALLFSRRNITRSDARTPRDIDHLFDIFDPFKCTKETPSLAVRSDTFLKDSSDPRLPLYFNDSLNITTTTIASSLDDGTSSPAYQVTVILLDRSRSMLDHRIASSNKAVNPTHADISEMMLGRLSDNGFSNKEIYAIGRIEFAAKYKTVCQITRSREQFEKAHDYYTGSKESTCMYDAICEAIRQINTFTNSPIRARNDCKKLIICLSDGINNYGDTNIDNLHDLVKKHNIVIDFISFIHDDQLKTKKEVTVAQQFRKLCTDSGGYIYQNLHLLSDIELASVFEQEAALWLSKRSKKSHGLIDQPERYISPIFADKAQHHLSPGTNVQNSSSSHRILKEFQATISNPSEDFIVFAVPNNIAFWKVILKGPKETPYQGQFWMLYVEFDSHYPNCAPDVRFITPIYHVNISGDGKICHPIFSRRWSQQTKMQVVFENILDLLRKPNFEDAMSLEKAHVYNENPNKYIKQAEDHAKNYGKSDIKSLKHEYQLED